MKTLKNRIISGAMAGVLAASLAVPAFAGNTTEVTGSFKAVTIDVVVQPKAVAFINPYGLDIDVPQDGNTSTTTTKISGQQIVSAPMALKNKTGMDLSVNASVATTIPAAADGEVAMKLAANTTKGVGSSPDDEGYVAPATSKSAFVYLEAKQEPTLTGADTAVDAGAIASKFAAWTPSTFDADKHVVLNATKTVAKNDLVVLRAADMSGASGAFAAYKAGSIALVRLAGDCVTSPKDEWKATDTFTASIAYTFAPAAIDKYDITVSPVTSTGTGTTTGVTVTPDVTKAAEGDTVTIAVANMTSGDDATITVKGADNSNIAVAGGTIAAGSTAGTATFTMPAQAVTVSVVVNK